nr:probable helicase - fission yeast (Schizosaccharomyces pombe) [Schizosaccharomyces pombe]
MSAQHLHSCKFYRLPLEIIPLICRFLSVQDIQSFIRVFPSFQTILDSSNDLFWKKKNYELRIRRNRLLRGSYAAGVSSSAMNGFVNGTQISSTPAEREYYSKSDEIKNICGLPPGPMKVEQIGHAIDHLVSETHTVDHLGSSIKASFFHIDDVPLEWISSICMQVQSFFSPAAREAISSLKSRTTTSNLLLSLFVGILFEDDLWIHNIVAVIESPYDEPNTKGLTSEQKMIVECQLNPGEVLKVKAFAGTGKTKALLEFAKSRPKDKILYVAFNKAAKEDAELRFPFNVKCSTMHGLAYGAILAQADLPQAKLERQLSNSTIASLLSLQVAFPKANRKNNPGTPSASLVASHIMFTLNRFMHSTDWQLGFRHISKRSLEVTKLSKEKLLAYTKKLWSLIVNFEYTHAPLIPDAYMKLLHLYEFPNIFSKYDYILFDEAQDFTPCMVDLIYRQKHARIVIVGDAHQCIYGFRGANACAFNENLYPSTKQLCLTKSFRFGNSVAKYANFLLSLKGENVKLKGVQNDHAYWSSASNPNNVSGAFRFFPHTIIFRTNKELILQSIRLSVSLPKEIPIAILGSMRKKAFQLLRSGSELAHGQRPSHPKLKDFSSWGEFEVHVKNSAEEDAELALVYDMADELFSESFLSRLDNCEKRLMDSKDDGDNGIILATAHQSKGLEWDNVQLGNDFRPKFDSVSFSRIGSSRYLQEEINILYVALTRAKKRLILNDTITKLYALECGLVRFAGGILTEDQLQPGKVALFVDWQIDKFSFFYETPAEGYNLLVEANEKSVWDIFFGVLSGAWQNYIANTSERLKRSMLFIENQLFAVHDQ